jgi:hypothetical protein
MIGRLNKEETRKLATDVNDWSLVRILLRLPQHLVRNGRGIAFTESNVLQQI